MPALIFLGRAWTFASDDFVCTGILNVLICLFYVTIMGVPYLCVENAGDCLRDMSTKSCFGIIFAVIGVVIVLNIFLSVMSSRGGVMETQFRTSISWLIGTISIVVIPQLVFHCANIYLATKETICDHKVIKSFIAGNSLGMIHIVGFYIFLLTLYRKDGAFWGKLIQQNKHSRYGFLHPDTTTSTKLLAMKKLNRTVERNLKKVRITQKCRRSNDKPEGDEDSAISTAANLFSKMFYDVDLVTSDLVTGLFLLRWQTNQWVGTGHRIPLGLVEQDTVASTLTEPFISNTDKYMDTEWLDIHRIHRVAQLGIAPYAKLLYLSMNLGNPKAQCRILRHLSCCSCSHCCSSSVHEHSSTINCCSPHSCELAAVLEFTSLKKENLIKVSFANDFYQSPYFVALDDVSKCIVISVRGTLSIEDTIVDLIYDGVHLYEIESFVESQTGLRPTFIGHQGMVKSSRIIYQQLITDHIIENALEHKPNYDLVVCGHSLGAGIASFLTLLLHCVYPNVKGYALSAPLGTMNRELAEYSKPFLLSIVYGFDMFARMNYNTIIDLKWRLVDALSACKTPKFHLLSRGMCLWLQRCFLKYCSPCCLRPNNLQTIGRDTYLLDSSTQERLVYPNPKLLKDTVASPVTGLCSNISFSSSSTDNDQATATRFRSCPRSLVCWIDSEHLTLLDPMIFMSENKQHNVKSKGDKPESEDSESHDLSDAVFGGRVLHLVDVYSENKQDVYNTDEDQASLSIDPESGQNLHSSSSGTTTTNNNGCCSMQNNRIPRTVIGVWSNENQFKTILVHPRMLLDHFPDKLLEAITCLRDSILNQNKENSFGHLKRNHLIRKLKDSL